MNTLFFLSEICKCLNMPKFNPPEEKVRFDNSRSIFFFIVGEMENDINSADYYNLFYYYFFNL